MERANRVAKELTGRHVLIITLSAFGVIIAVNLVMAFLAVGSFPGLEVKNSYVASQQFDRDRLAQERLGWTAKASYDGQQISIEIVDGQGAHPVLRDFTATVGRPTHTRAAAFIARRWCWSRASGTSMSGRLRPMARSSGNGWTIMPAQR